jgi:sporulation protein YhbH
MGTWNTFTLSQQGWDLQRKGPIDQARHDEKVKEAIRENLADIISEQAIIGSDGKSIIKVPIRSLDEYRFRFGEPQSGGQAGQGPGGTKPGDVLGPVRQPGDGSGQGAGNQPGPDVYEAEISIDTLMEAVFADLGLPHLEEKKSREIESETIQFTDIRKRGPFANLDKRRTIRENLKRNALQGRRGFADVKDDDLRYKTWDRVVRHESNAVVLALMDVSGSMGTFEKYVSKAFYFWMVRFLRTKYERVEIRFIAHHATAKEVTQEEFFARGESGGTVVSSAYQLALEILDANYPAADWNIYPFHFSDGDNWSSDNDLCIQLMRRLLDRSNQVGYGEIRQRPSYYSGNTLKSVYDSKITDPKFQSVVIKTKADVYPALKQFFAGETESAA